MSEILVVVGTRPEAVKLAPVIHALRAARPRLVPVVCATAQHREMLDQVLMLFGIRPEIDLDVMRGDQSLTFVTTEVLTRMGEILRSRRPALVLVQGDTTTTMAASLAAFYERIPVGHVEAGLRTADRYSPYPEELNRRLTTQLAEIHFAATELAARTLCAERVDPRNVYLTGNPVVDAILWVRERIAAGASPHDSSRRVLLVTAHRRENFGDPIRRICRALRTIADRHPDVEIVYPVHPNPNVTGPVRELLGGHERIRLVAPLPYDQFVALMDRSYLVLSDSGGLQEEAPVLGKPVLVLRENTERSEAVAAGATRVVGTDAERIVAEAERLLSDGEAYAAMSRARSPFGDGRAAERIAAILLQLVAGDGTGADEHRFSPS